MKFHLAILALLLGNTPASAVELTGGGSPGTGISMDIQPQKITPVIDKAMQMHGAAGLTEDFFMAEAYNYARQIRLADGPDQVHMMQLGREVIRRYAADGE